MSNKKIKFAHLVNVDFGITIFLLPQIQTMQKHGWEAHAVCPTGKDSAHFYQYAIKHHAVNVTRDMTPATDMALLWQMYKLFKKEKFDVVHAHSAKMELFGQLAARLAGVPLIFYTNHGLIFRTAASPIKIWLLKKFAWFSAKLSHHIFSQAQSDLTYCIDNGLYPANKSSFLGNGIDLTAFDPTNFDEVFKKQKRKELGIPADAIVIGMVGRFVKEKGYEDLWHAFAQLAAINPKLFLLCIGNKLTNERDPVDFNLLNTLKINNVSLILESRNDVPELMSIMQIFAFGSYREGFPRVLMEASSMGIPIAASNISGCNEAIKQGVNGVFFEAGSVNAFSKAIESLLNNHELYNHLAANARSFALHNFDVKRVNERIETVYLRHAAIKLKSLKN